MRLIRVYVTIFLSVIMFHHVFFSPSELEFFFFLLFMATPLAYGGSQARGQIGAVATGLYHSHSNARSKLCLRPTPQLTQTPDP